MNPEQPSELGERQPYSEEWMCSGGHAKDRWAPDRPKLSHPQGQRASNNPSKSASSSIHIYIWKTSISISISVSAKSLSTYYFCINIYMYIYDCIHLSLCSSPSICIYLNLYLYLDLEDAEHLEAPTQNPNRTVPKALALCMAASGKPAQGGLRRKTVGAQ